MNFRLENLAPLCSILGAALALGGCVGAPESADEPVAFAQDDLTAAVCPASVPSGLAPAANQKLFATFKGVGVQIYGCAASGNGYAWTLIAPQADLLDANDALVGTHFAGPTWQALDGSSVKAAKSAGATPDPSAIAWLLLTAVGHGGQGVATHITSIQRLSTTGGLAPASGCDASTLGASVQVPYTAQYYFYETTAGQGPNLHCGN